MTKPMTVDCPTCGTAVEWAPASAFRPFCSDRCKLIDLGERQLKGKNQQVRVHALADMLSTEAES